MKSGIYKIEHITSGKKYIGSSVNVARRLITHRDYLNRDAHHNVKLQNAWKKYGAPEFSFETLLVCRKEDLVFYEQLFMDYFNTAKDGYNISPTAGNCLGVKHTDTTKAKMSAARKEKKQTALHIANAAKTRIGRKMPPRSPEHCAKISALGKGRKLSKEFCEAASKRMTGVKLTEEARAKIGAAHRGRKFSPERCKMMSEIVKGKKHTEKSKMNMTAALKLRHALEATNFQKKQKNNKSGYKGVCLHKGIGRYAAEIRRDNRRMRLGYFDTAEEAHRAYCQAAVEYQGELAKHG